MIDIEIDLDIFNTVYIPLLKDDARTQILFGGSASGKSVFVAQRAVYDLLEGKRNYLICRQTGRSIRKSVFNEIVGVINDWGVGGLFYINKTDGIVTCSKNKRQALFIGLDDVEKIKSIRPEKGAITDIWIEEATEIDKNTLKQLTKRQRGGAESIAKRLTMSFNPIYKTHWIYEDYFSTIGWAEDQTEYHNDDLTIIKTTYKDNRFLTEGDHKDLENEKDSYYYDVYTLGNWGVLGNVIFKNWKVEDLSELGDQFTNKKFGLDFGFASDPAALICTHYDKMRKVIYIFDELYETELTNPSLADLIKPIVENTTVVCDSAEPKSIRELRDNKINAIGAKKGKDSVLFGIQWLQQQTIIIDKRCINASREFQMYKWIEGSNGQPASPPRPIDKNNHIIDALRYCYEDEGKDKQKARSFQG